ncbi:hypothetical protein G7Y89_g10660 [Cudoniella acicularis]|uniref:Flavin reductase like domain-containing protein n=1 Tax=Cudoniella acicularis TaxID=354080 RepID=A0A8H4RCC1_9HELO|nr:hypothetical protein G7Y89_g10660 [Cudoniella acicularis]
MPAPLEAYGKEALVKQNPHADFAAVEASRPEYSFEASWTTSKTPSPSWQPCDGASRGGWEQKSIAIDPQSPPRTVNQNYKLMISSTISRPIALVSTVSTDGRYQNLAPFSYFNNVANDLPLYSLSFHGEDANVSLRNLQETGELSISIVSDWFLEAANFTSVNTPPHISEWPLSGLHPVKSLKIRPSHVAESAFSMEYRVHSSTPIFSKTVFKKDGTLKRTATLVLAEAVMFNVQEDVIDEQRETVDIKVLRLVWRGGGTTYGNCFGGWETPRPDAFRVLRENQRVKDILQDANDA